MDQDLEQPPPDYRGYDQQIPQQQQQYRALSPGSHGSASVHRSLKSRGNGSDLAALYLVRPGLFVRPDTSTLRQETGRILRHRVTEETRQVVRQSTLEIENGARDHNMKLRRKFEKRFIDKIKV
jgi:hypothetical protein